MWRDHTWLRAAEKRKQCILFAARIDDVSRLEDMYVAVAIARLYLRRGILICGKSAKENLMTLSIGRVNANWGIQLNVEGSLTRSFEHWTFADDLPSSRMVRTRPFAPPNSIWDRSISIYRKHMNTMCTTIPSRQGVGLLQSRHRSIHRESPLCPRSRWRWCGIFSGSADNQFVSPVCINRDHGVFR